MTCIPPQFISDSSQLSAFCHQIQGVSRIGLDTEFIGEHTYDPKLEIIQLRTQDTCAILDVPAIGSWAPLAAILRAPGIVKILHAGRQDIELLTQHIGAMPQPLFDTQVASALVGYGAQIGYAALVQRLTGTQLDKSHTLTNWSDRPLSQEQLAYAAEDVYYLLPIHAHLVKRLTALGRVPWVEEECHRLLQKPNEELRDPRARYQRIRGWGNLTPKALGVLRELAAWREEEARHHNLPRGRVLRDEVLLELARRHPRHGEALKGMRGLPSSVVKRHAEGILACIQTGLAVPPSQLPEAPKTLQMELEQAGRIDLLQAVLKACAHKAAIAPTLLATSSELQEMVEANMRGETVALPILSGWRWELAGELLLQVVEGKVTVGLDPRNGKVRIGS